MTTDKNGAPALIAYPVRAELDRERNKVLNLTQQEAERLARGEVIQKAVNVNGEKTQQYLQLDPETKSVIHKRVTDIKLEQRLKDMEKVNDIELGMQQKQLSNNLTSSSIKILPASANGQYFFIIVQLFCPLICYKEN